MTSLAATIGNTTITTNSNLDIQDSVTSTTDGSGNQPSQYNKQPAGIKRQGGSTIASYCDDAMNRLTKGFTLSRDTVTYDPMEVSRGY